MKVTYRQIATIEAITALAHLRNTPPTMLMKDKVAIARLSVMLRSEQEVCKELHNTLITDYIDKAFKLMQSRAANDEERGKLLKPISVPPQYMPEFLSDYDKLLSTEVEIVVDPLPIAALGDGEFLSAEDIYHLDWLFKGEPVPPAPAEAAKQTRRGKR